MQASIPRPFGTALTDAVVMVVEDDPGTRAAMAYLFQGLGARVVECPDAEEACAVIQHALPDAVICDIFLPGMDGYYLVQKLRERELQVGATPAVAIALTGDDGEVPRLRSIAEGFQHFMAKPPDIDALVTLVVQALRTHTPPPPARGAHAPAGRRRALIGRDTG
jgi:two-component system, cell cycle response regulator CtrA